MRIAGVGPLVSLLLGALFTLGAWLLYLASVSGIVVGMVAWLAGINVLLAVFNAVPAAPLDGGRLLRAFLWWRTGDRLRATAGATVAGRIFGWLLVVFGLIAFMRTGAFGGLWPALIGWFLIAAATAEGRQAQLRGVLAGVPVRDAMTLEPLTVSADTTVVGFLTGSRYRYRYRHSAFPVTDDGAPVGLVTLDSARKVPQAEAHAVMVSEVMVPLTQTTVVEPDAPLADLLPRMEPGAEHRVRGAARIVLAVRRQRHRSPQRRGLGDQHPRRHPAPDPDHRDGGPGPIKVAATGLTSAGDLLFPSSGDTAPVALERQHEVVAVAPGGRTTTLLTVQIGPTDSTALAARGHTVYVDDHACLGGRFVS
ncbi:site-2 protease family protein [Streptomyces sp. NPDC056638]|uniref:site-2 protease family protein n=1 Tax=Streptomyces sp. NPDC056638 TaxID=3345887 RepID=UPI0036C6D157